MLPFSALTARACRTAPASVDCVVASEPIRFDQGASRYFLNSHVLIELRYRLTYRYQYEPSRSVSSQGHTNPLSCWHRFGHGGNLAL